MFYREVPYEFLIEGLIELNKISYRRSNGKSYPYMFLLESFIRIINES